eukprot:TRINITY_DN8076_c0_g1_i1.p1 TRINITY_DN8076_c0_g1~~TRINITY_DN8076_c0_g1_i1.p1  ORF type:complete len:263 (+),score=62.21 TRINITY_DN8076_c0_g1_i1:299-1087(+)
MELFSPNIPEGNEEENNNNNNENDNVLVEEVRKPKKKKGKEKEPEVKLEMHKKTATEKFEYFWKHYASTLKLSIMEMEDKISEESFVETYNHENDNSNNNNNNETEKTNFDFISNLYNNYETELIYQYRNKKKKSVNGSPRILIITHSAKRAVELMRLLKNFDNRFIVTKLFAKHIKIKVQSDILQTKVVNIAVGTPNRILKLAQLNDLSLKDCDYLVIDCEQNIKRQTIFDLKDTNSDLFKFYKDHCHQLVKSKKLKICMI